MPSKIDWCDALFRHYFSVENQEKEVLLYCDHNVIAEVGKKSFPDRFSNDKEAVKDFQKLFSRYEKAKEWFDEIESNYTDRINKYPVDQPPGPGYFPSLLLTIIAFAEFDNLPESQEKKLMALAYYERLAIYLQKINPHFKSIDTEKLKIQLGQNFHKLKIIWEDLEQYVNNTLKGNFGCWRVIQERNDPHVYVRIPRSQLIFRPIDRSKELPEFFNKIRLLDKPDDWKSIVQSTEFKRKFKAAADFEDHEFVASFLENQWKNWINERNKKDKKSSRSSDYRSASLSPYRHGKSHSKNKIHLKWCFDSRTQTLKFTPYDYDDTFLLDDREIGYRRTIDYKNIAEYKEKEYRFNYSGKKDLNRIVILRYNRDLYGADFVEYTDDDIQALKDEKIVLLCPTHLWEKMKDFEGGVNIPSPMENIRILYFQRFQNTQSLNASLGFKPRLRDVIGLNEDKNFLNMQNVLLLLDFVPQDAKIIAKRIDDGYELTVPYYGMERETYGKYWTIPAFSPPGKYEIWYDDKKISPRIISIIAPEIHPEVGDNIPWRNLYGDICENDDKHPAYKGFVFNAAAMRELNIEKETSIVEIAYQLELETPTDPVPDPEFTYPDSPADLLLYYLTHKNEISYQKFKDMCDYFKEACTNSEDKEKKIFTSRFEPHGYIDVEFDPEAKKRTCRVQKPTLILVNNIASPNQIAYAYVGARTPERLLKIHMEIKKYAGEIEIKPVEGLPSAVYLTFDNEVNACKFARKLDIQIETDGKASFSTVPVFSKLFKLLSTKLTPEDYIPTPRKHKLNAVGIDIKNKGQLKEWEYFDPNRQKFLPLTDKKTAELKKTMLLRKNEKNEDDIIFREHEYEYFKPKNTGKDKIAKAYLFPKKWIKILYYAHLAQKTKTRREWWKKVLAFKKNDPVLRVRNEIGLPTVLDRIFSLSSPQGTQFQNAQGQPSNSKKKYRAYPLGPELFKEVVEFFGTEAKKSK